MKTKTLLLLALLILQLSWLALKCDVYADERKVLSRNYVGLRVDVYASYQSYPGENITVKVKIEALEDIKNASVTLFLWSSKLEGQDPWGISFTILNVADFLSGTVKEEVYNITVPSDVDPGLIYGILFLDWNIYRSLSWESQWDKASFRATYLKNKNYENLQEKYNQLEIETNNWRIMTHILLAITMALAIWTIYLAKKRKYRGYH